MALKRQVLDTQARAMVASVIEYFSKEKENNGPLIDVKKVLQRVADACGISLRAAQRINAEVRKVRSASQDGEENIELMDEGTAHENNDRETHEESVVPVSYTHLDVYKRQRQL